MRQLDLHGDTLSPKLKALGYLGTKIWLVCTFRTFTKLQIAEKGRQMACFRTTNHLRTGNEAIFQPPLKRRTLGPADVEVISPCSELHTRNTPQHPEEMKQTHKVQELCTIPVSHREGNKISYANKK